MLGLDDSEFEVSGRVNVPRAQASDETESVWVYTFLFYVNSLKVIKEMNIHYHR